MAYATGSSSAFPQNLDQFLLHEDISLADQPYVEDFQKQPIGSEAWQIAKTYLLQRGKILDISSLNKLYDSMYKLQNFTKDTITNYYRYRGVWQSSPASPYAVFNSVLYNGNLYLATATPGSNLPTNTDFWLKISSSLEWKGDYAAGTTYPEQSIVRYKNASYISLQTTTGNLPDVSPSYWKMLVAGLNWANGYTASKTYSANDLVFYRGSTYVATENVGANEDPLGVPNKWQLVTQGFNWRGLYQSTSNYYINDTVRYGIDTYVCLANNFSGNPRIPDVSPSFWSLMTKGGEKGDDGFNFVYKGEYKSNVQYQSLDAVTYIGTVFHCHTTPPTIGIQPTDSSYWEMAIARGDSFVGGSFWNRVVLNAVSNAVEVGISAYTPSNDTLMVYCNSVFLYPDIDYTINTVSNTAINKVLGTWEVGTEFNFVVLKSYLKNVVYQDGGMLEPGTITLNKLSEEVQDRITQGGTKVNVQTANYIASADGVGIVPVGIGTYNRAEDILRVYFNQLLLVENLHYTIDLDGTTIELLDWTLEAESRMDFEVWKNVQTTSLPLFDGTLLTEGTVTRSKLHQEVQDTLAKIRLGGM